MGRKTILIALSVISAAMVALPAAVSAGTWHLKNSGGFPAHFWVSGGGGSLSTANGETINCNSVAGDGSYENSTTGTMELTFSGCKAGGVFNCTTSGSSTGTIRTTTLPFHNILVWTEDPGVLLTPDAWSGTFAHFVCGGFLSVTIEGNGVIGGHGAFECDSYPSSFRYLNFNAFGHGWQQYEEVTGVGTTYNLTRGGAVAALDLNFTTIFGEETYIECT